MSSQSLTVFITVAWIKQLCCIQDAPHFSPGRKSESTYLLIKGWMMEPSKALDTMSIFELVTPVVLAQTLEATWTQNGLLCIQS